MAFVTMAQQIAQIKATRPDRRLQAGAMGNLSRRTLDGYKLGDAVVYSDGNNEPRQGFLVERISRDTWKLASSDGDLFIETRKVLRRGTPVAKEAAHVIELTPEQRKARREDLARAYAHVVARNVLQREAQHPTTLQNVMSIEQVEQSVINRRFDELEKSGDSMVGSHSSLMRGQSPGDYSDLGAS